MPIGVCFVCAGNICRSPSAEGIFRHLARERGVLDRFDVDSAGTGTWHVGEAPNVRARDAARARGVVLEGAARQFRPTDFERFDHILAMDHENRDHLRRMAVREGDLAKIHLLREFDPTSPPDADVPDPYYGGVADYELVIELCVRACAGLLDRLAPR